MNARRLLALTILPIAAMSASSAAGAQTSGGELGPDYVRASASDLGTGTFPAAGLPSATPSAEPLYSWSRADTGAVCVVFAGPIPPALEDEGSPLPGLFYFPDAPIHVAPLEGGRPGAVRVEHRAVVPPDAAIVGDLVVDTATSRASGADVLIIPRCAQAGEPLPPAPPSPAEIWQQTPLTRATVHASPPGTRAWPGITNMESRFWGTSLPDVHASVTLRGYDVSVAARPIAYAWAFGDGTTTVGAGSGDADSPARVVFHRRGDYVVVLYVVWVGVAHTSAPPWGFDFGDQYLGTVTIPERVVYHEAEIRALLRSRTVGR